MNRIDKKFQELKAKGKKALIVYMTAGDPSLAKNEELIYAFEKDGVDLIELGVPFSDPLADGPVIQAASGRAIGRGTTLSKILALVKVVRINSQVPILLMSYLNPILSYGLKKFVSDARKVGVDGVIIPDLPPDEGKEISKLMREAKLCLVYLLAPTSTDKRIAMITKESTGFVYYVSLTGVTGLRNAPPTLNHENIKKAQRSGGLPVCVGFGISEPKHAKAMSKDADGVIVGSALVKALHENSKMRATQFSKKFVRPFVLALRSGS